MSNPTRTPSQEMVDSFLKSLQSSLYLPARIQELPSSIVLRSSSVQSPLQPSSHMSKDSNTTSENSHCAYKGEKNESLYISDKVERTGLNDDKDKFGAEAEATTAAAEGEVVFDIVSDASMLTCGCIVSEKLAFQCMSKENPGTNLFFCPVCREPKSKILSSVIPLRTIYSEIQKFKHNSENAGSGNNANSGNNTEMKSEVGRTDSVKSSKSRKKLSKSSPSQLHAQLHTSSSSHSGTCGAPHQRTAPAPFKKGSLYTESSSWLSPRSSRNKNKVSLLTLFQVTALRIKDEEYQNTEDDLDTQFNIYESRLKETTQPTTTTSSDSGGGKGNSSKNGRGGGRSSTTKSKSENISTNDRADVDTHSQYTSSSSPRTAFKTPFSKSVSTENTQTTVTTAPSIQSLFRTRSQSSGKSANTVTDRTSMAPIKASIGTTTSSSGGSSNASLPAPRPGNASFVSSSGSGLHVPAPIAIPKPKSSGSSLFSGGAIAMPSGDFFRVASATSAEDSPIKTPSSSYFNSSKNKDKNNNSDNKNNENNNDNNDNNNNNNNNLGTNNSNSYNTMGNTLNALSSAKEISGESAKYQDFTPKEEFSKEYRFANNFPIYRKRLQYSTQASKMKSLLKRSDFIGTAISPDATKFALLQDQKWMVYTIDPDSNTAPSLLCCGKNNGHYGINFENLKKLNHKFYSEEKLKSVCGDEITREMIAKGNWSFEYCALSNNYLVVAGKRIIKMYDLRKVGKPVYTHNIGLPIRCIDISPNEQFIACGLTGKDKITDSEGSLIMLFKLYYEDSNNPGGAGTGVGIYEQSSIASSHSSSHSSLLLGSKRSTSSSVERKEYYSVLSAANSSLITLHYKDPINIVSFSSDAKLLSVSTALESRFMVINISKPSDPRLVMKASRKLDTSYESEGITDLCFFGEYNKYLTVSSVAFNAPSLILETRISNLRESQSVAHPRMLLKVEEIGSSIHKCTVSPRNDAFAFLNKKGSVYIMHLNKNFERKRIVLAGDVMSATKKSEAASMRFSKDGYKLYVVDRKGILYIEDFIAGTPQNHDVTKCKSII